MFFLLWIWNYWEEKQQEGQAKNIQAKNIHWNANILILICIVLSDHCGMYLRLQLCFVWQRKSDLFLLLLQKKRKICIVQRLVASNHPGGKLRIRTAELAKRNAREYIRVFDLFAWHFEFVGWECSISHNSTTEKLFSILLNWESIESWEREKQGPFFCVSLVTCSAIDMLVYN